MGELLCKVGDLQVNETKTFKIGDESILLFRLEEGFYATQSRCTHLFKSLEKGKIVDGSIQCPLHRARFCIKTGDVVEWANFPPGVQLLNGLRKEKSLKTYAVTVTGDDVSVEV